MDNTTRSSKDIKRGLLKAAFAQGRGREMIAEINRRVLRSQISEEERSLMDKFNVANENQPQAVRALNVRAERDGVAVRYSDAILLATPDGPIQ